MSGELALRLTEGEEAYEGKASFPFLFYTIQA